MNRYDGYYALQDAKEMAEDHGLNWSLMSEYEKDIWYERAMKARGYVRNTSNTASWVRVVDSKN